MRFWICCACSVTWFSAVVQPRAAATFLSATACCETAFQLLSIDCRHALPAKLFDSAIFFCDVSPVATCACAAPPNTHATTAVAILTRIPLRNILSSPFILLVGGATRLCLQHASCEHGRLCAAAIHFGQSASNPFCGQANHGGQATGSPRQYNDCVRRVQFDFRYR